MLCVDHYELFSFENWTQAGAEVESATTILSTKLIVLFDSPGLFLIDIYSFISVSLLAIALK